MDAPRRRRPTRALTIALAVSFGVHLGALAFLRSAPPARAAEPMRVSDLRAPRPRRIDPTPTPRPRAPPPPIARAHARPQPARALALSPPRARARAAHAPEEAHPLRTPRIADAPIAVGPSGEPVMPQTSVTGYPAPEPQTASPEPTAVATQAPACAGAPRDASVIDAVTPERPSLAAAQDATGHVEVRVDLTASGAVSRASLYRSSGNALLDRAAVDAAEHATYAPASDGCRPIGGSYVYTVDYTD